MKKLLCVLIIVASILNITVSAAVFIPTDVEGTGYDKEIDLLLNLNIIKGYEDGTFKAFEYLTRGEFAVMAALLLGVSELQNENGKAFEDVPDDHYASESIGLLANLGIL